MDHEVQVGSGMGPVHEPREIGDRRHDRNAHAPGAAGGRQDLVGARVGAHDHVRALRGDRTPQAAAAGQHRQAAHQRTRRREARDQPVLEVEQPGQPSQDELGATADDEPRDRAGTRKGVEDQDVGVRAPLKDPVTQCARRQIVPFADVGAEDDHPHPGPSLCSGRP
jgi:hypothetical protein